MKVGGKNFRTIWINEKDDAVISIIDQRFLPHQFIIEDLHSVAEMVQAIREMHVRGAGLIGAAAGYGMYLAAIEASKTESFNDHLLHSARLLKSARPTAVNPENAIKKQIAAIATGNSMSERIKIAKMTAIMIADEDAEHCRKIGLHGVSIIEQLSKKKSGEQVNILTHCNAGWLAFVDCGSATAPIYEALQRGINIHVWVDETRPRNQGAGLTAWEFINHGVPHTVITDNAGGHLMQHGFVDIVITGADRVTRRGDAANKIGTYLKALAAHDNQIPFYVALPSSTFDWRVNDGLHEIKIEERSPDEVKYVEGWNGKEISKVLITPSESPAANYAFDVTPSRLITGLICERGICKASEDEILKLFPEKREDETAISANHHMEL